MQIFWLNFQMTSKNFMKTSQLERCTKDGLIVCKVLINSKINLNRFILPGNKKFKKIHGYARSAKVSPLNS